MSALFFPRFFIKNCLFFLKDIQPLLSKYFSENELKIMRIEVIKMTLQKRENSANNIIYQIARPLKISS